MLLRGFEKCFIENKILPIKLKMLAQRDSTLDSDAKCSKMLAVNYNLCNQNVKMQRCTIGTFRD